MLHHFIHTRRPFFRGSGLSRCLGGLAFLLLSLGTLAPGGVAAKGEPALVVVDQVVREPLQQTQPIQGRFVARQSGPVAARTRGTVTEVHTFVGERVKKGDPIVTIDTERLAAEVERRRAEIEHRQAQVEGAEARFQQANQELDRLKRLRESAAFSRARYDDQVSAVISAKSEIAEYQAMLRTARAELALAEIDLAHATVRAPFSGVVTQRHTQAGAYLRDGDPVVNLIDDLSLEIEADVPASRIGGLKFGVPVTVLMEGQPELTAEVRAVIPQENTLSRTRAVRFMPDFDPTQVGAAGEAAVTVRIPVDAPRDVLTVHKDAVLQQGGTAVYVVEEGEAVRKPVFLGDSAGSRFIVKEGLEAGMLAVVRGNERLRPGQPVRFEEPAAEIPKAAAGGIKKDADS